MKMEKNSFLVKWSFKFSVHLFNDIFERETLDKCKDEKKMSLMAFFFLLLWIVWYIKFFQYIINHSIKRIWNEGTAHNEGRVVKRLYRKLTSFLNLKAVMLREICQFRFFSFRKGVTKFWVYIMSVRSTVSKNIEKQIGKTTKNVNW